jgi:AraC-like DNA-binding protein
VNLHSESAINTFRSEEVSAPQQIVYWREFLSDVFMEMEPSIEGGGSFNAAVDTGEFGNLTVATISAQRHKVRRTQSNIANSNSDAILFHYQISGKAVFYQGEAEETILPGDIACIDTAEPFELDLIDDFRCITVKAPRKLFVSLLGSGPLFPKPRIRRNSEYGAILGEYFKISRRHIGIAEDEVEASLSAQFCETLALAQKSGPAPICRHLDDETPPLLGAVLSHLRNNLAGDDLTPPNIADHFGISVRYLHLLFEPVGLTLGQWLLRQRLKRCFNELTDPEFDQVPISTIAYNCGFNDLSYFGRSFKARYNVTPRQARGRGVSAR